MSLGIQILARRGVFSSVTWTLVAISAGLVPFLGRFGDPIDDLLVNASFLLMLVVAFLTQCMPSGVKRNIAPFVAAAVVVLVQYGVSR